MTGTTLRAVRSRDVRLLAIVIAVELCLLALYFAATPAQVTRPRYVLYPFVWVNVALWVVRRTDPPVASRQRVVAAGSVAVLYLLVLLWLSGLVGVTLSGNPTALLGVNVGYGSPGWERVRLVTPLFHLTLIPFRVVGYIALSYLVYVTVLDAAAAAVSGALGFVACLSCGLPILGSLATGVFGASAGLTGTLYAHAVDVSTAVFLLAVALLYYRPGFGRAGRRGRGQSGDGSQRME